MERRKRKTAIVLLAAGQSRRYGGIKLLDNIDGKKMYLYTLELLRQLSVTECVVVTGYEEIKEKAEDFGLKTEWNSCPGLGISHSLKMGLKRVLQCWPGTEGVMFLVCDQPYLMAETVNKMLEAFADGKKGILCPALEGSSWEDAGNPCIIGRAYFEELFGLEGDVGGKQVIRRHSEDIEVFYQVSEEELKDIDTKKL